jgi:large conductance mechanosensitive channel
MLKEFRDFIARGNVIDLAVGVIIGAAFGAITTSIVNDLIMPPIGMLLGGVNLKDLFIPLNGQAYASLAAAQEAAAPVIAYGNFIQAVINFIIIAFVVFLLVKAVNKIYKRQPATPVGPTPDQKLLTEIRDLLAQNQTRP